MKTKLNSFDNKFFYKTPFHVGLAGNIDSFPDVLTYFLEPDKYKKTPRLKGGEGIILSEDGKIWTFSSPDTWFLVDQPYYAIGSGMNFAIGAMASGATAYEAIKQTINLDPNTGMGITKIDL